MRFLVTGLTGNFFGDDLAAEVDRLMSDLAGGAAEPFLETGFLTSTGFAIGFLALSFSDKTDFDFVVGLILDFLSPSAAGDFFGVTVEDLIAVDAFAVGFVVATGGFAILVGRPDFVAPDSLDVLASPVLDGEVGWGCLVFEEAKFAPAGVTAVTFEASPFVFAPLVSVFPSVCLTDAGALAGLGGSGGGGGGGGGALGLLVLPRSLKTATTNGCLWPEA